MGSTPQCRQALVECPTLLAKAFRSQEGWAGVATGQGAAHWGLPDVLALSGPTFLCPSHAGDKSEAKALMSGAGVPVVPGYHGEEQSEGWLQVRRRGRPASLHVFMAAFP